MCCLRLVRLYFRAFDSALGISTWICFRYDAIGYAPNPSSSVRFEGHTGTLETHLKIGAMGSEDHRTQVATLWAYRAGVKREPRRRGGADR